MKEEEIKEIIRSYTQEEFTIEKFSVDEETGETTVIVKFVDREKAASFVEKVSKSSDRNIVKNIRFASESVKSFSATFIPFLFNLFAFI